MAGYTIFSIDREPFEQLTTSPTIEQALVLADIALKREQLPSNNDKWPSDRDRLVEQIRQRLGSADWYSDLTYAEGVFWEYEVVAPIKGNEALGVQEYWDTDFDSIYWDVCQEARKKGAAMMDDKTFGHSGFRYFGKPTSEWNMFPMHSIFSVHETKQLYEELQSVETHFAKLKKKKAELFEEFFDGLMTPVRVAAENERLLWVVTDT